MQVVGFPKLITDSSNRLLHRSRSSSQKGGRLLRQVSASFRRPCDAQCSESSTTESVSSALSTRARRGRSLGWLLKWFVFSSKQVGATDIQCLCSGILEDLNSQASEPIWCVTKLLDRVKRHWHDSSTSQAVPARLCLRTPK